MTMSYDLNTLQPLIQVPISVPDGPAVAVPLGSTVMASHCDPPPGFRWRTMEVDGVYDGVRLEVDDHPVADQAEVLGAEGIGGPGIPLRHHPGIVEGYQAWLAETAIYPGGLTYPMAGMAGEAGEANGDLLKVMRRVDRSDVSPADLTEAERHKLLDEISDVLAYLVMLLNELGASLAWLAVYNRAKLLRKKAAGVFYNREVGKP